MTLELPGSWLSRVRGQRSWRPGALFGSAGRLAKA